jgi:antitoxin (DNA-binding transcriptional repressor) of toxin-antitoxin stability system
MLTPQLNSAYHTSVKRLGISETKTRLSQVCAEVAQTGEIALLTRRGKPLVRIDPLDHPTPGGSSVWEARERYEATYGFTEELPDVERRPV